MNKGKILFGLIFLFLLFFLSKETSRFFIAKSYVPIPGEITSFLHFGLNKARTNSRRPYPSEYSFTYSYEYEGRTYEGATISNSGQSTYFKRGAMYNIILVDGEEESDYFTFSDTEEGGFIPVTLTKEFAYDMGDENIAAANNRVQMWVDKNIIVYLNPKKPSQSYVFSNIKLLHVIVGWVGLLMFFGLPMFILRCLRKTKERMPESRSDRESDSIF